MLGRAHGSDFERHLGCSEAQSLPADSMRACHDRQAGEDSVFAAEVVCQHFLVECDIKARPPILQYGDDEILNSRSIGNI